MVQCHVNGLLVREATNLHKMFWECYSIKPTFHTRKSGKHKCPMWMFLKSAVFWFGRVSLETWQAIESDWRRKRRLKAFYCFRGCKPPVNICKHETFVAPTSHTWDAHLWKWVLKAFADFASTREVSQWCWRSRRLPPACETMGRLCKNLFIESTTPCQNTNAINENTTHNIMHLKELAAGRMHFISCKNGKNLMNHVQCK